MSMGHLPRRVASAILVVVAHTMYAQQGSSLGTQQPGVRQDQRPATAEPTSPPAEHVLDPRAHLSFTTPAGWTVARHDGEISTFALDARTSLPSTRMDVVAGLDWNPYPSSTFAGALFYVSQTPRSAPAACLDQASSPLKRPTTTPVVDGVTFRHGYAEHGGMCIESRDEVYTALRSGSCLRFDLVINTFCAQASGAREISPGELASVERRLQSILDSVRFDSSEPSTATAAPTSGSAHAPGRSTDHH